VEVRGAKLRLRQCVIDHPLAVTGAIDYDLLDMMERVHQAATDEALNDERSIRNGYTKFYRRRMAKPIGQLYGLTECTLLAPVVVECPVAEASFLGNVGLEKLRVAPSVAWPPAGGPPSRRIIADARRVSPTWRMRRARAKHDAGAGPAASATSSDDGTGGRDPSARTAGSAETPDLQQLRGDLEAAYRGLRAGLEEAKAAPAAADFYFGEMEARRRRAPLISRDRPLLFLYRWVGGYGVRALPPLLWLVVLLVGTWLLLWHGHDWFAYEKVLDRLHVDQPMGSLALVLRNSISILSAPAAGLTPLGVILFTFERYAAVTLLTLTVFAVRSRVQR
jgi:hypothetical protein